MYKSMVTILVFLALSVSSFAQTLNPCIQNMDKKIGTLYLCGFGGQFKVLSLERCNLKDTDIPAVLQYLNANPRINALDLSQNKLTNEAALALAKNTTLTWLNFSYNTILGSGIAAIAGMPLTHLELISDQVGDDGLTAFETNTRLQSLELSYNHVTPLGAKSLAKISSLRILTLDFNRIEDAGAISLANVPSLTHLYLRGNMIGDAGAASFANLPNLKLLNLIANQIGDNGAIALAATKQLQWLYLDDNHISPVGIAALNNNPTYVDVTTTGNGVSNDLKSNVNKYLSQNAQGKSHLACR